VFVALAETYQQASVLTIKCKCKGVFLRVNAQAWFLNFLKIVEKAI